MRDIAAESWDISKQRIRHNARMSLFLRLLGYRRERGGLYVLPLIGGTLGCMAACVLTLLAAPSSVARGTQAGQAARPSPAELSALPSGSQVLVQVQLPRQAADEETGLAVVAAESRDRAGGSRTRTPQPGSSAQNWTRQAVRPATADASLSDGSAISLQLGQTTVLYKPDTLSERDVTQDDPDREWRYSGYKPAQTLTADAEWTGDALLVRALYPGTPDEYVSYLTVTQPLESLRMGLLCGVTGAVLLIASAALRLLRAVRL